ncbi:MAG: D-cysteine desulfhydrase family protein [Duodenibacillus sp.]|nr:D-cysteine desulfhydrase family protein [Duodenibacillus sp.]
MTDQLAAAREKLARLGKLSLGFYPTPFHKLERISEEFGINLWIKREDFSGASLFGGNKIRKLEYLLKEARDEGCDTVFTYGATQSNHAMQTCTAARRCGMRPVLYLGAIVEPRPDDVRANLLLDRILGAEIHILPSQGRSTKETMKANEAIMAEHRARLAAEGHKVYDIPIGGSTPRGAVGFAEGYVELLEQAGANGLTVDYLYTATGSCGTLGGLVAGKVLSGETHGVIRGMIVGKKDPATYAGDVAALANKVLELLGEKAGASASDFELASYVGPGYEKPYHEANDDIRYLARTEGIFTDPVYSGKAFHGMMDQIRKGLVPKGSTVVFLHTGGATALFSEAEIIGDLSEKF